MGHRFTGSACCLTAIRKYFGLHLPFAGAWRSSRQKIGFEIELSSVPSLAFRKLVRTPKSEIICLGFYLTRVSRRNHSCVLDYHRSINQVAETPQSGYAITQAEYRPSEDFSGGGGGGGWFDYELSWFRPRHLYQLRALSRPLA